MRTINQLAFDVTCRGCGGGLTITNPGGTCGTESKVIVACVDCGAEWVVLALMRPLHRRLERLEERADRRIYRSKHEVAQLVRDAYQRVAGGESVRQACMAVGVDRRSYYARYPVGVS